MRTLIISLLSAASGAAAQTPATNGRFVLEFDRAVVSASNPSVTLYVSAAWDQANPGDWTFGAGDYDLVAADGRFTSTRLILGQDPPNSAGVINGSRVDGAAIGQAFGPHCGILGCPTQSQILLAEYTWVATDFTPRTVGFITENTMNFTVVSIASGFPALPKVQLFPGQFRAGAGSVEVVPAPAGGLVAAGGIILGWRRRR